MSASRRVSIFPAALSMLAGSVLLAGCSSSFPRWGSHDWDITTSQGHNQWRVAVQDTMTGQELWATEIPDGQSLVIDFETENYKPTQTGSIPADKMTWGMFDMDASIPSDLPNEVALSGNPVMIRKTLRESGATMTVPAPSAGAATPAAPAGTESASPPPSDESSTPPAAAGSDEAAGSGAPNGAGSDPLGADDAPR